MSANFRSRVCVLHKAISVQVKLLSFCIFRPASVSKMLKDRQRLYQIFLWVLYFEPPCIVTCILNSLCHQLHHYGVAVPATPLWSSSTYKATVSTSGCPKCRMYYKHLKPEGPVLLQKQNGIQTWLAVPSSVGSHRSATDTNLHTAAVKSSTVFEEERPLSSITHHCYYQYK